MSTPSSVSGCASGIRSAVRLAAITPARWAAAIASPLGWSPDSSSARVARCRNRRPRAVAVREVVGLRPTSTIRTRPRASRCESLRGIRLDTREPAFLVSNATPSTMTERSIRLPVSTRRAFALAFDLAARRDPLQSLVIPCLPRAPWALTLALLPPLDTVDDPSPVLALGSLALLGDFFTWLLISSMLRIRAQSVFNTPRTIRPAPVGECYARGLRRTPWLLMTEVVRNVMLGIAAYCSFLPTAYLRLGATTFFRDLSHNFLQIAAAVTLLLPTLFLGFRLGVATEAVVLTDRDLGSSFQRSLRMMQGRFERWVE